MNEVKEIKKNYYFLKLFICVFVSLLYIEGFFKVIAFGNLFGLESIRIILFSAFTSMIVSFICSFLKPILSKIFILIFVLSCSIYTLVQLSFKNFMGNYMSVNAGTGGGLGRVTSQIKDFISYIRWNYYFILIPFIALLVIFIFYKKFLKREKHTKVSIGIIILSTIVIWIMGFLTLRLDLFQDKNQIKSNKELYNNPTLLDLSLKQFGSIRFLYCDIKYMLFPHDSYELIIETPKKDEEIIEETDYTRVIDDTDWLELINTTTNSDLNNLNNFFINQGITDKNDYTGLFEGKNLILIMVEAFDMSAINETVTPTLYKLAHEGWYFDNYYTPKYSCTTGESEFIALTSIIPSATVCTPNTYVNNDYSTSIFKLFNDSNYYSSSYHNWTDEFYNRTKLHTNMGSSQYLDYYGLNIKTIRGWQSDLELFEKSLPYYVDKDKFFTFTITSSTHFPYDVDSTLTTRWWDNVKDLPYTTKMKRYLAKAVDLDKGLEYLLKELENKGILEDTVIVLFGDHHPLKMEYSALDEASSIDRFENFNMDRLPFIIYNSELEPTTISKTASTFDILPTLANLFNLNYDPRYYVGKDIFSNEEGIVIFTNGSWITDQGLYNSTRNEYTSLNGDTMTDEYIASINKQVNDYFYVSNKVLTLDYFKYRFNN